MEIERKRRDGDLELVLNGRLDAVWSDHTASEIQRCIQDGCHRLLLNMAGVTYLSSAGIRVLVRFYKELTAIDGRFQVVNPSEPVAKVLSLSGLAPLLYTEKNETKATGQDEGLRPVVIEEVRCLVQELEPNGRFKGRVIGKAEPGIVPDQATERAAFPDGLLGLGFGCFPGSDGVLSAPGEFLALAGAAAVLPSDGSKTVDYFLTERNLVPEVDVVYGFLAEGTFRTFVRFESAHEGEALPLSRFSRALSEISGRTPFVAAWLVETSYLIGASLILSQQGTNPLSYPAIRNNLSFTSEPAYRNSVALCLGVFSKEEDPQLMPFLRPLSPNGDLYGHVHAVAFPYQPIRRGALEFGQSVSTLFEKFRAAGLLHLIYDWREATGAGESHLLRGAAWLSPLELY